MTLESGDFTQGLDLDLGPRVRDMGQERELLTAECRARDKMKCGKGLEAEPLQGLQRERVVWGGDAGLPVCVCV